MNKDSPDTLAANNVFIAANDGKRESVTSARSARLETQGGERMALLSDGQRLETSRDKPGVKISEFSLYGTRIGSAPPGSAEEQAVKTRTTYDLVMQPLPAYRAELGWRLGLALAALNFVLLGLAVASVNPRAARSTSMVFALFAFIVYYNLDPGPELGGRGSTGTDQLHGDAAWRHAGSLAAGAGGAPQPMDSAPPLAIC